jgi:arsenical pump membrane protein
MFLPTLVAGIIQIAVLYLVFRKQLKKPINCDDAKLIIKDVPSLLIGLIHLAVCFVLLIVSSYVSIEMWLICAICALSLTLFVLGRFSIGHRPIKPIVNTFKRLPYDLIPFILSMFAIVLALKNNGVTEILGNIIGKGNKILNFGVSGYLFSNLINNIPMSVLFSTFVGSFGEGAVYATIIGSNIGAFLTPVGALAGIMFTDLVKKQNVDFGFKDFIKYGFLISIPTLLSALAVLSLVI